MSGYQSDVGLTDTEGKFRSLFQTFGTVSAPANPTTNEEQLPGQYTMSAGTIERQEGLRILIVGSFRHSFPRLANPIDKTFRVYVGDALVLSNKAISNPEGEFKAEILLYNVTNNHQKGFAHLQISGQPDEIEVVQLFDNDWSAEDVRIRMTVQTPDPGQSQLVNRFTWSVERVP